MNQDKKVVVLGAGLSGLSISRALISEKIPHIMIGKKPNTLPKLGESMNPEGTTELINFYPDMKKYFYPKTLTIIGVGKNKIHCKFSKISRNTSITPLLNFVSPGLEVPKDMIHIDRANLDISIFESIKDSEYLTHIDEMVEEINYNENTDNIDSITLKNGQTIETDRVFDATNHVRLVGRNTNQKLNTLSCPQQVTFCHYYSENMTELDQSDWHHSTNLLKLTEDEDGVDGFAWCIPINDYLSTGISINKETAERYNLEPSQTIEILEKAYEKRGLKFKSIFSRQGKIQSVINQYFTYERAYGKNWLLAGPAYSQIWYMSGSGVATALTAAYMAPKFVKNPQEEGQRYQEYMDQYLRTHHTIDWFVKTDKDKMEDKTFQKMTTQWLMSNILRMVNYPKLRNQIKSNITSSFINKLMELNIITARFFGLSKFCPVEKKNCISDIWIDNAVTLREQRQKKEDIVYYLFSVISNKREINEIENIMSPKVNLWMDHRPVWGRWFWKTWVRFLQSRTNVENLTLTAESFEHHENHIDILARWSGKKNEELQKSQDVVGRCYFKDDKLIRIESKITNYDFILGNAYHSELSYLSLMAKVLVWKLFAAKNKVSILLGRKI